MNFEEAPPGSNFLNLEDLYGIHKKKDVNKIEVYRRIYQKCQDKIKKTNDQLRKMECQFEVPTFLWGTPIYDYDDLKSYIIFRLRENGITHCYFIDQHNLYISWRPQHIDKKRYQAAKRKYGAETAEQQQREREDDDRQSKSSTGWGQSVSALGKGKAKGKGKKGKNDPIEPDASGTMKFGSQFEVPVNMDKIRMVQGPRSFKDRGLRAAGQISAEEEDFRPRGSEFSPDPNSNTNTRPNPPHQRRPPNRHLLTSWQKYFSRMRGPPTNRGNWANPYM